MNPFSSFTRRRVLFLAAALGAGALLSGCHEEETHVHGRVYHDPYAGGGYYHHRDHRDYDRVVYEDGRSYDRGYDRHSTRNVYVSGNSYSQNRSTYERRHTYPYKHSTTTVVTPEVTVRRY